MRLPTKIFFTLTLSLLIYFSGCSLNKSLRDCSVSKHAIKATKAKIFSQIDSIYSAKSIGCDGFKKINSCSISNDSIFGIKKPFVIKVENKCKGKNYFYLNEDFKIIQVITVLQPIY